jgi:mono/diheme cytochrome c family protein
MNEERKKTIQEKYKLVLQKGERFWPDSIYKDLVVSCGIFILLILLATFVGVPGAPKADPSDTSYVPRPEWYFLFLFKFLGLWGQIPVLGKIEWIATVVIPAAALLLLLLLPLGDRNPFRHYSRRVLALTIMSVFVVGMVVLTLIANVPTPSSTHGIPVLTLLQFLAGMIIPLIAYLLLVGLGFFSGRGGARIGHAQIVVAACACSGMLALGGIVLAMAPASASTTQVSVATTLTQQIQQGQQLYSLNCAECHGDDGTNTTITGVAGLEGTKIVAIHSDDVMYTLDDITLQNTITYGRPNSGMPPFGTAYGGALSPSEIDYLVTFLRYSWDDRVQLPAGVSGASSIPTLEPGQVPSYDVDIAPLVTRYCIACHQSGRQNDNYLVGTYDDMLHSGDNTPVMVAGDANSLLLQLVSGHPGTDTKNGTSIRAMPPTQLLDQQYIDMLTSWVMHGMPKTAQDAAKLSATPTP